MDKYYLLAAAITPSFLMLWYFHARDLNKERWHVVGFTFILGIISMIPVFFLEEWILKLLKGFSSDPYIQAIGESTLSAGVPEEFFKVLVVLLYAMRHREFDEPMDGIVYGAAASLGFAAIENIYFVFNPRYYGFESALIRALTTVPFHATMGAIMGYFLGQGHFQPRHKLLLYFAALFIPILLHSFYDYPWITLDSLNKAQLLTKREQLVLPWFSYFILIFSVTWTMTSVKKLRIEQELQAVLMAQTKPIVLEEPSLSFPVSQLLPKVKKLKTKVTGWTLLIVGSSLATLGGLFILSLLMFLLSSRKSFHDTRTIFISLIVGTPSLTIGIFLFNRALSYLRPQPLLIQSDFSLEQK